MHIDFRESEAPFSLRTVITSVDCELIASSVFTSEHPPDYETGADASNIRHSRATIRVYLKSPCIFAEGSGLFTFKADVFVCCKPLLRTSSIQKLPHAESGAYDCFALVDHQVSNLIRANCSLNSMIAGLVGEHVSHNVR